MTDPTQIFTPDYLDEIFPLEKSDAFFEAMYGDAAEGAYDIRLRFEAATPSELHFLLHLEQRPGKCLAYNHSSFCFLSIRYIFFLLFLSRFKRFISSKTKKF